MDEYEILIPVTSAADLTAAPEELMLAFINAVLVMDKDPDRMTILKNTFTRRDGFLYRLMIVTDSETVTCPLCEGKGHIEKGKEGTS